MADTHDIAVDFMDMTDDRRLWARAADVRDGFELAVGRHVIVRGDHADPRAARIVAISSEGLITSRCSPALAQPDPSIPTRPGGSPWYGATPKR